MPEPPSSDAAWASLHRWVLGAWSLHSYLEQPDGEGPPNYPLGEDAEGTLIYSPDGYMSALLTRKDRPPFASGDWFGPTQQEARAASAFIAYSGTYSVDEHTRMITHHITGSFFPNLVGQSQVRHTKVEGDDLILTPAAPILSGGRIVVPQLRWSRARPPVTA